jgi:hypothetical protein
MAEATHISPQGGAAPAVKQVLYMGPASGADELCSIMSAHIGKIEIAYQTDVQKAILLVQQRKFDTILVDLRDGSLAAQLVVPLFCSLPTRPKIIVVSPLSKVTDYLGIPGVARVLTAPMRPGQVWRVLELEAPKRSVGIVEPPANAAAEFEAPAKTAVVPKKSIVQWVSDRFMNLISIAYKRLAFILLFALFIAFTFYGVLIGFFLLSSGWAAPMTLTRGHMLVDKVEAEISSLKVQINQNEQRQSDVALAQTTAKRELADAADLVNYVGGTIKKELVARKRQVKVFADSVRRLEKIRARLSKELEGKGPIDNLNSLYSKRLVTKNYFEASNFSVIEAHQRLVSIENEVESMRSEYDNLQASMGMLASLKEALLRGEDTTGILAGGGDMLLMNKQAVDALAARSVAKSKLATALESEVTLSQSIAVLRQQLAATQSTALARAVDKRVDVLFVPYGNEQMFLAGAPLYSCRATIFFCSLAGHAGAVLPGEVVGVHPFFGKNIRGFFVEVKLDNEDAAMREIIHGYRKPFFF